MANNMEVIFIKDLRNQGKKGQIKNVKDGYAENFLIKNGYAVLKTKENLAKLNHELKKKEELQEENKKTAEELKKKLDKEIIEFKVKTGEQDRVFGTVSVKQIKEAINNLGYHVEKQNIKLDHQIDTLGVHEVIIELHKKVKATIKVKVSKK